MFVRNKILHFQIIHLVMSTAKKKRSRADIHSDRVNSPINKLGGEEESNRILVEWESHRRAQVNS